jgi:hypothetical protein
MVVSVKSGLSSGYNFSGVGHARAEVRRKKCQNTLRIFSDIRCEERVAFSLERPELDGKVGNICVREEMINEVPGMVIYGSTALEVE